MDIARALANPFEGAECVDCDQRVTLDRLAKCGDEDRFLKSCGCGTDQIVTVSGMATRVSGVVAWVEKLRIRFGPKPRVDPTGASCAHCGAPDDGRLACRFCGTAQVPPPRSSGIATVNIRFAISSDQDPDQIARAVTRSLRR